MLFQENILVCRVERPLPKLDYYGAPTNQSEPADLLPDLLPASVEDQTHRSHPIRDGGPSATKRKSSELETTEEEVIAKRGCRSLLSSSLELGVIPLPGIFEGESELLSRQQQEEEDRRLALLLQKELDQEEKRRATDRRKGSADAYQLRQSQGGTAEANTDAPSRAPRKTTKTSFSSSSSSPFLKTAKTSSHTSSSRGSKQTTLTEMFSSLSS